MKTSMKNIIPASILFLLISNVAQAHFLWIVQTTKGDAEVYFGQAAHVDYSELIHKVTKAKAWSIGWRGNEELKFSKVGNERLRSPLSSKLRSQPLALKHEYGVISRGDATFLLRYYAKSYPFSLPGTWKQVNNKELLPFEISPSIDGKDAVFHVAFQGKPAPGCQVVIVGPGIEENLEETSDEAGVVRVRLPSHGLYSIRARLIENKAGKLDDKKYASIRHYSTLAVHYEPAQVDAVTHKLPELPQGITSLGAAVAGNTLYLYGGNYGSAHEYSQQGQSNDLWALELPKPSKWKKVGKGPKLQGLAMVEHAGQLYPLGGFTAMNKAGEDHDLQSQAGVSQFAPKTKTWKDLPGLPEPRSSFDAVVSDGQIFVAGGWNMPGKGKDSVWHTTAYSLKLGDKDAQWQALAAPPFKRRALSLAAWKGKIYCIGGMQERGGPTTRVDVFDVQSNSWQNGPSLNGTALDGFGASAFACHDGLYVSTLSGSIQRLSKDGKKWQFVGQLDYPRFFHRMLPWQNKSLVFVGGGNMEVGKVTELSLVPLVTKKQ
ncbi:MAG: hypothetical protein CMJ78_07640 [Planctomycetaceae bacterium]|nr:hypothetical protein [Planctomycetaceae bacterium]